MFHHLAQLLSQFCQFPISPGRTRLRVNTQNLSQPNPVSPGDVSPCIGTNRDRDSPFSKRLSLHHSSVNPSAKDGEEELDGRASPPPPALASRMTSVGTTLPPLTAKEKPPINVVGDVGGKGRKSQTNGLTLPSQGSKLQGDPLGQRLYLIVTLIREFHHVAYMPCQFCQIYSCPSRNKADIGSQVNKMQSLT